MLKAFSFQPYKIQAMNLLFSNMAVWYLAINKFLFKAISENTMAFINIFKLSTDYMLERKKIKIPKVNSTLDIDTLEEDALLSEVKGPVYLIQCFFFYCIILLYFTPFEICYNLIIGLHAYFNRLLSFTLLYTWDSVKLFPFILHYAYMLKGIADKMG